MPGKLDISLRGSVILAGTVKDAETLDAAAELPVRGLILSSIFPSLLQKAREMRYPYHGNGWIWRSPYELGCL
jgi:hypothetical protein